jgi:hypothetical protein
MKASWKIMKILSRCLKAAGKWRGYEGEEVSGKIKRVLKKSISS